ncbi:MAG: hypothetical protein RR328_02780 [Bacteroidales bacterium]
MNEMLQVEKPTILAHFDKITMNNKGRYFSQDEPWYHKLVQESIDVIKQNDTIVEINTRGLYKGRSDDFFPCKFIIQQLKQAKIPTTISLDAHKLEELSQGFDNAYNCLLSFGYKEAGEKNGILIFE